VPGKEYVTDIETRKQAIPILPEKKSPGLEVSHLRLKMGREIKKTGELHQRARCGLGSQILLVNDFYKAAGGRAGLRGQPGNRGFTDDFSFSFATNRR